MRRLLGLVILAVALAGCGVDRGQVEACRTLAEALAGAPLQDVVATGEGGQVTLRFAAGATGRPRMLACRFAGNRFGGERLALTGATLDGAPVAKSALVLLGRSAGLSLALPAETPADLPASGLAYLLQQLVNGLTLGALLALVATGYSLVYSITGTIQFAYGEMFMIGAVTTAVVFGVLEALQLASAPLVLALGVVVAGGSTALYGWAAERVAYRPLRRGDRLAPLVAAIGLAIALREYVRLAQGSRDKWLPPLFPARHEVFAEAGFTVLIADVQIAGLALAAVVGAALAFAVGRTRWGRAHRACAQDPFMAALLGVATSRVVSAAFALGGALAALAGVMVAFYYGQADFSMGYLIGFKALTAALLGGFGSLAGACLGGLLIGLFETLWSAYAGLAYKDAAVFAVLVLVLLVRPQGLLGAPLPPIADPRTGR